MPRILSFPSNPGCNTYVARLPTHDEEGTPLSTPVSENCYVFDNRAISLDREKLRFQVTFMLPFHVEIKRVDGQAASNIGWETQLFFRVYEPRIEDVPAFLPDRYTYHGLKQERAPATTEVLAFPDDLCYIRGHAFTGLSNLTYCFLGSRVEVLCRAAFSCCTNLKTIVLSPSTTIIGKYAFRNCRSLVSIYIPKNVYKIDEGAFSMCPRLRFVFFEDHRNIEHFRLNVFFKSFGVFSEQDFYDARKSPVQRLMSRYDHLPLHLVSVNPYVTSTQITTCMDRHRGTITGTETEENHGMTALHIMVVFNKTCTIDSLMSCFRANETQMLMKDNRNKTPMDYLLMGSRIDVITSTVLELSKHKINF